MKENQRNIDKETGNEGRLCSACGNCSYNVSSAN